MATKGTKRMSTQAPHGMSRAQARVVLEFLGVPFEQQGKTVAEQLAAVELKRQEDPARFKQAVDLIVFHKAPKPVEIRSETLYHELGILIDEKLESEKADFNVEVSDIISKHKDDVMNQARNIVQAIGLKGEEVSKSMESLVKEAIEKAAEQYKTIQVQVGTAKPVVMKGILHEEFDKILQLAVQRKNIMLVGPAGCGKTHLAGQLADALKLPYSSQSVTEGMSESMLSGWLLPVSDGGKFTYVPSEFVRIYETGGVFLLDEMDAADPNVLVFINQALANESFVLPQRHENPVIKKHKDFVCVAACNTFGSGGTALYTGRNSLDAATLDRFRCGVISMDYSAEIESKLVDPEVLAWGLKIRKSIKDNKLIKVMSTRFLRDATDMKKAQGWTMDQIQKAYFSDWTKEEKLLATMGG